MGSKLYMVKKSYKFELSNSAPVKVRTLITAFIIICSNLFAATAKSAEGNNATDSGRYIAVKTNLAYDIFAVMNIGAEIQATPKLSVEIPVIWSLWDWKSDFGLRTVAIQPEVRYWFGRIGTGHALCVNIGVALYNFRHDRYRYQNPAYRPMLSIGVGYAYSLTLTDRWNLEFSVAAGYVNTRYKRYYNIENGAKIDAQTKNYFGPTKAGITISYRLGR